jgi:hypothetical protein
MKPTLIYMPQEIDTIAARYFVLAVLGVVAVVVGIVAPLSWYLHTLDIPYTDNDIIRAYHLHRLAGSRNIETLVVGDSSAGNAVDAGLLEETLSTRAYNAALTGSFGLEGSYNMIRQAIAHGQPLKNVIIIHTLDIWHRPYSEQGLVETGENLSLEEAATAFSESVSRTKYLFNPKELWWFARYQCDGSPLPEIRNGYLIQQSKTYAAGTRVVRESDTLSSQIHPAKLIALELIDRECRRNNITGFLFHGPIHETVALHSTMQIACINKAIQNHISSVTLIPEPLILSNEKMGDSIDHAAPSAKAETTTWYARHLRGSTFRRSFGVRQTSLSH